MNPSRRHVYVQKNAIGGRQYSLTTAELIGRHQVWEITLKGFIRAFSLETAASPQQKTRSMRAVRGNQNVNVADLETKNNELQSGDNSEQNHNQLDWASVFVHTGNMTLISVHVQLEAWSCNFHHNEWLFLWYISLSHLMLIKNTDKSSLKLRGWEVNLRTVFRETGHTLNIKHLNCVVQHQKEKVWPQTDSRLLSQSVTHKNSPSRCKKKINRTQLDFCRWDPFTAPWNTFSQPLS